MKLLRMTATFGKLAQQTLTLHDGLNLIELPNEAGKSTWAEFLLAMLYGIDTGERERAGVLPVKTKYQPWSSKPMQGTLELEHAGKQLRITRTSTARAPLGTFSAVYADSGLPVEGMTGQNCGQLLLGVPKSVYQRSGFVRQTGLGLTPDGTLEARLQALVTTGDESVSFAAADRLLQGWQNHVRYNKTGLIPDCERELAAVDDALRQLHDEQQGNLALHARLQALQAQEQSELAALQAARAQQLQQKRQQLYEAKRAVMQAANRENAAAAVCAKLPPEAALQQLAQDAEAWLYQRAPDAPQPAPPKPVCPPVFTGVEPTRLMEKAQRDAREFDRLCAKKHRPAVLYFLLAALSLALAALGWLALQNAPAAAAFAVAGAASLVAGLLCRRHNAAREQELSQAQELLQLYENHSRDEFTAYAADYREALRVWSESCEQAARDEARYSRLMQERERALAALLGSVRMFSAAEDATGALEATRAALSSYAGYREAQRAHAQTSAHYAALEQALGALPELPEQAPPEPVLLTEQQAQSALESTRALLTAARSQLDLSRGRLEGLGSEAELSARKQALVQQLQAFNERRTALELARQTLMQANTALAARFSPRLVQEASALFAALSGGRYTRVQVDRRMELEAAEPDAPMRRLLSLSCGTADGLYLAVRLAICRLLLPEQAPLVLDDALAMLDDERMRRALALLQQEARTRQVLLFTCHSRERTALEET